jgi:hypothetical protein
MRYRIQISNDYRTSVIRSFFAQLIVVLLAGFISDGGLFLITSMIAAAGYWLGFVLVVARHPKTPAKGDIAWANFGFPIMFAVAFAIGGVIQYFKNQM